MTAPAASAARSGLPTSAIAAQDRRSTAPLRTACSWARLNRRAPKSFRLATLGDGNRATTSVRRRAGLVRSILVDPNGPEAAAFRSSEEAAILAGPIGN
jgi:hypothetical protein